MKDLIRQILREETSGLTDAQIKGGKVLMDIKTKGYDWYNEIPQTGFFQSKADFYLYNPETKRTMLRVNKNGDVWYDYRINDNTFRYVNIVEQYDFLIFLSIWIKDKLNINVRKFSYGSV